MTGSPPSARAPAPDRVDRHGVQTLAEGNHGLASVEDEPPVKPPRAICLEALETSRVARRDQERAMGAISLKLPDSLLEASGQCAGALRVSRAEYIRRAIEQMNRDTRSQMRAQHLAAVSKRVRKESMRVNAEFAKIEHSPDA